MLTLQRRHTPKCPDRNHEDGPNFLGCRGHCPLKISGMLNGRRVRTSLRTRDIRRATKRMAEMEEEDGLSQLRKALSDAIEAFHYSIPSERPRRSESTGAYSAT
jgi:hypothetical protein